MPANTIKEVLNNGKPTDVPMGFGLLNFGSQLEGYFSLGIDAADRTVTSHVCTLVDSAGEAEYGHVLAVHATVGGVTGPFSIVLTGTPTTTQVLLEDAGDGQPKLTFAAADAVTGCRVQMLKHKATRDGTAPQVAMTREIG